MHKRFVKDIDELTQIRNLIKSVECIFCKCIETLNNHGLLSNKEGKIRGARVICRKNRKSNPGCGKTFTIYLSEWIPFNKVSSNQLWNFLKLWKGESCNIISAWSRSRCGFALETAYRWASNFKKNESLLREALCRLRAPPEEEGCAFDVFHHLISSLKDDVIFNYQIGTQKPWIFCKIPI
jgi:hypothetical protein